MVCKYMIFGQTLGKISGFILTMWYVNSTIHVKGQAYNAAFYINYMECK
ncbi:hypothetical protein [Clostridioides difficile]